MSSLKRHSVPLKSSTYERLLSSSLSHIHVHALLIWIQSVPPFAGDTTGCGFGARVLQTPSGFQLHQSGRGNTAGRLSLSLFALANNCEDETLSQEILWHTSPQHLYTCTWAAAADTQSHRVGSSVTDNCTSGISSHTHTHLLCTVCVWRAGDLSHLCDTLECLLVFPQTSRGLKGRCL